MRLILFSLLLLGQSIPAQDLQSFLSVASFNSDPNPFLETYLSCNANSLNLINENNKYYGEVDVRIKITSNEMIVFNDHYILKSPLFDNPSDNHIFFIDQQRIPLKDGEYLIEFSVSDTRSNFTKIHSEEIMINYIDVSISDIQLIENYSITEANNILSKSGYNLTPYASNFYPKTINGLTYYMEIYNTNFLIDKRYLLHTYIESFETNIPLSDYNKMLRKESSTIESNLLKFNISNLPTGNYNLVCNLKDVNNQSIIFKKIFFQRSNTFTAMPNLLDIAAISLEGTFVANINNKDSLRTYIDYLYPISSPQENTFAQNQLRYDDLELMQKFFFNFWQSRNKLEPVLSWNEYLNKVNSVNDEFSYFKIEGYLTDRGRVYLQYGSPNSRHREIDAKDNRPYEIWHYYKLKNQSNKKFVFIDNNRTGEYKLEFSNVDGEESNLDWIEHMEQDRNKNSQFRNNYINPR